VTCRRRIVFRYLRFLFWVDLVTTVSAPEPNTMTHTGLREPCAMLFEVQTCRSACIPTCPKPGQKRA
jgi:hypothetical protein